MNEMRGIRVLFIGEWLALERSSFLFFQAFMSKSYFLFFPFALHVQHLLEGFGFVSSFASPLTHIGHTLYFPLEEICFLFFFWQVSSYINAQKWSLFCYVGRAALLEGASRYFFICSWQHKKGPLRIFK